MTDAHSDAAVPVIAASDVAGPDDADPVIDAGLVRRLVGEQFPAWSHLPVTLVVPGGVDNRTFRLGTELSVRLPSARRYAAAVDKEHRWLPFLASRLPVPVPVPVARGAPAQRYPFEWSVYRWLAGRPLAAGGLHPAAQIRFARDLAGFLATLAAVPVPDAAPRPGIDNFHRGGPLQVYADQTLAAIDVLGRRIDRSSVLDVWQRAVAGACTEAPVWFHGDVAAGNLLVVDDRLSAVIDFGTSGVGDPACDLTIAWTFFTPPARAEFRRALLGPPSGDNDGRWARGRGWALWKSLIGLAEDVVAERAFSAADQAVLAALLGPD